MDGGNISIFFCVKCNAKSPFIIIIITIIIIMVMIIILEKELQKTGKGTSNVMCRMCVNHPKVCRTYWQAVGHSLRLNNLFREA